MRHVMVRGGGINVRVDGPAAGPAVVFVNSLGTDLHVWDEVVALLPPRLRLIRADKRGHGLSSVEPASRSMRHLAEDLAGVLDALGVRDALFVGLSIGGPIALTLADARPDLARGLVMLDTAHRIGTDAMWNSRIAAIRGGGMAAISGAIMDRWFSPAFRAAEPGVVAAWQRFIERIDPEGYIACCEALRDADLTEVAGRLRLPVRFAGGSEDLATPPELVRGSAALMGGARFDLIEGVGHLPPVERPAAVAALVTAHLGDIGLA